MSMIENAVNDYGLVLSPDIMKEIAARMQSERDDGYDAGESDAADKMGMTWLSEFTGEALVIADTGRDSFWESDLYCCECIYYLPLDRYPSLFAPAYNSIEEAIDEVKESIGEYLPNDFNYRGNIRHIVGTYWG